MHFLSREIIFHVRCRWWCFLRSFRRNKGQIFKSIAQAWHRNEAPKSVFWFGSSTYRLHRYRCHIGTGFRYPTLTLSTNIYNKRKWQQKRLAQVLWNVNHMQNISVNWYKKKHKWEKQKINLNTYLWFQNWRKRNELSLMLKVDR